MNSDDNALSARERAQLHLLWKLRVGLKRLNETMQGSTAILLDEWLHQIDALVTPEIMARLQEEEGLS